MVVAFHMGLPVPGGFVGVDAFFVISGFVITAMLMREWSETGGLRLGRFYVRRFKRLTPALALTVSVVLVASALLLSPLGYQQTAALTAMGAMALAANLMIAGTTGDYFDAAAESNPLLHTWSLSVEEQFYLLFPAILLVSWLLGRRVRRPALVALLIVGLLGALSLAVAIDGSLGAPVPDLFVGFYGPVSRAWEFAAGALLALCAPKLASALSRFTVALFLGGAGMLLASLWCITSTTPFPGAWTLLPVTGTVLLIAAGSTEHRLISGTLGSRPMVAIGDRSYSIYLWHWPFIAIAQLMWPGSRAVPLAAAVLSFIPAYASFRWVEQPIRALPRAGRASFERVVAATVLPPLLLASAIGIAALNGFGNTAVQAYKEAIQKAHLGNSAGCTQNAYRNLRNCTWNADAVGPPIYLVGDSNADQFSEALVKAARLEGRPLVILAEDGCSYLANSLEMADSAPADPCVPYWRETNELLMSREPGLVVIANAYSGFDSLLSAEASTSANYPERQNESGKLEALSTALSEGVRSLQGAGHSVMLVQAVPHWGSSKESLSWATCSALDMMTIGCSRSMPLQEAMERQGPAADVVERVARATNAAVLDVSSALCPDGICTSVAGDGLVQYRDGTHITVDQSRALASIFERAIQSAR
jgi:peptidoglycan/LPS O-acetylase OafA/YrhL